MLLTALDTLDAILEQHADALGADRVPYRHHAYRVINFCAALSTHEPRQVEKMQIAVAFHDLGIWTDQTFDYLAPSKERASEFLRARGSADWQPEIDAMILEHHKLRSYRAHPGWLVEPFRRADLVDVSYGARSFGLARALIRDVYTRYPDEGFHGRLVQLAWQRTKTHPLSPLPMLRF
ncbi:MAG TPA: hypothetical protein VI299_28135 [Polyangiales bacterium]